MNDELRAQLEAVLAGVDQTLAAIADEAGKLTEGALLPPEVEIIRAGLDGQRERLRALLAPPRAHEEIIADMRQRLDDDRAAKKEAAALAAEESPPERPPMGRAIEVLRGMRRIEPEEAADLERVEPGTVGLDEEAKVQRAAEAG